METIQKVNGTNLLKRFDFKPYLERVEESLFDLSEMKDNELSEYFGIDILHVRNETIGRMQKSNKTFTGVNIGSIYEINYLSKYLGSIPETNQSEVIEKHKSLSVNPLVNVILEELMILAPHNNFEGDNNISGIDPIIFAVCEINNQVKLIKLTQWI